MYKTTYACDCCGKEMTLPMYTLELNTNSLCVQDRVSWHYCDDCWEYIKKSLIKKNELNDLEKTMEELKEENEKLKKDARWYEQFFTSIYMAFLNSYHKNTGYGFTTTTTTNEGETIQRKPFISNGPFSVGGCCCENTNKDSLEYKQTTW